MRPSARLCTLADDKVLAALLAYNKSFRRKIYGTDCDRKGVITIPTKKTKATVDVSNDDFGAVLNCAVRYACGRRTYMPGIVIEVISPLLNDISPRTIGAMEKDIREADKYGGWGDETADKPGWMRFLADIQRVMDERGIERWR